MSEYLVQYYDTTMYHELSQGLFRGSDFSNYGYWDDHTTNPAEASANLMEKLLSHIPSKDGRILDVACGKGATTRHLLKHFAPNRVFGTNISAKQLETASQNAPGVDFRLMDATAMSFDDESFESIICVEAAFHFHTRRDFLEECLRILKPGGRLVLTDVLATLEAERGRSSRSELNYLASPADYAALLSDVGFRQIEVTDASTECWKSFFLHLGNYCHQQYLAGSLSRSDLEHALGNAYTMVQHYTYYLLVSATKPTDVA